MRNMECNSFHLILLKCLKPKKYISLLFLMGDSYQISLEKGISEQINKIINETKGKDNIEFEVRFGTITKGFNSSIPIEKYYQMKDALKAFPMEISLDLVTSYSDIRKIQAFKTE